ncbi:MAG: hypothetical protein K9K67_04135 [Bacteriovoracaceae bacterium]|nr:hypothetical protein [Bacteriovoracaceae bacterium]
MTKNTDFPIHCLIGDTLENFYQLGLQDKGRHSLLLNHATGLFRTRWTGLNKGMQQVLKAILTPAIELHPRFKKRLEAYSEGLGARPSEVAMGLLVPEMMSFMEKWIPGVPHTLLGCSSYFIWDESRDALVHGRTLDFPFHGSFDLHERGLQTTLDDGPVTFSFSSAGFPYPSITAMTKEGVTLSLHQKFGKTFNYQGTPIFDIAFELLQNCGSREETIRFLKKQTSITSWAFYMGFSGGQVLSSEIDGDKFDYSVHQAVPEKCLYFCNVRENKNLISHDILPYGFQAFNEMRIKMREKKMRSLGFKKNTAWTAEKLIRFMGFADEQENTHSRDWLADPMTPSTLQNICLIPDKEEALLISGLAPKFFKGEVLKITDAFGTPKSSLQKFKGKTNTNNYQLGLYHYMQAQVAQDKGEYHESYHNIQMAIEYFGDNPYATIARFFFNVFQYMHETHRKSLSQLLTDFKSLEECLPPYLQDHNTLFIARLEKILKGNTTVGIEEIKHTALQRIYDFEKKMPRLLFHSLTRELMAPRLELLDVIYPHVKAGE